MADRPSTRGREATGRGVLIDSSDVRVDWGDMVVVGRIARPHGLRGHVIVQLETDFPDTRFQAGASLLLGSEEAVSPRRVIVKDARWHGGRLLVAFEGIERLEDAESLRRSELRVPPDALAHLPPGRFYHHQLVGCEVWTVEGQQVGDVVKVEGAGAASTLVVNGRRGEVLVPLAEDICVAIDVEGRRITVAPPDGLLDLNA